MKLVTTIALLALMAGCASFDYGAGRSGPVIVGFDYDGTCALDMDICRGMSEAIRYRGGISVAVTARAEALCAPVRDAFDGIMPVVCAGGRPKSEAAADAGYRVNYWVDDRVMAPAWYEQAQRIFWGGAR